MDGIAASLLVLPLPFSPPKVILYTGTRVRFLKHHFTSSSTISCVMLGTPDRLLFLEHPWGLRGFKGSVSVSPPWRLHRACLLFGISQNLLASFFFFLYWYLYYNISSLSLESETILCKFASPAKLLLQQILTEYLSHMWPYAKLWRYSWVSKNEAYCTAPESLLAIVVPPIPGTVLCTW